MTRTAALLAGTALVVGLAATAAVVLWPRDADRFADCRTAAIAGGAAIGGPFTLTDHTGREVTEADVITGPTLVYFGYTYCPDVCPLDTTRNLDVVDRLAERGMEVKPVFITIDPARDTVEALAEYVGYLHEDLVGLTGTDDQIAAASKAYKTYYAKNGEGEDYLMDHSTFTYLMDPEEGLLAYYRTAGQEEADAMAENVACYVERL
ncbi:SCO family protein [Oceanomicrobium pacificus]|uniref:SCO family protein n=1 Tax=Oceanomicrobium pacificus TaxID=2692916 RepID=A0A6B0TPZ1_9RHOB|nr:SCO family protein [Oceanomicrobium pacificus]MXU64739.1 SCO family protein [Oceanomicrobium pacificus]